MARPTILTNELQQQLVDTLANGVPISDACAYVGITDRAYYGWMARGKRGGADNELYIQFFQEITRARVRARVSAITMIRKSVVNGNTEDARWFLERSDPANWGRHNYTHIEGLEDLLRVAKEKGVPASDLFNAMLAELMSVDEDERNGDK
jgi:hypothetical protein